MTEVVDGDTKKPKTVLKLNTQTTRYCFLDYLVWTVSRFLLLKYFNGGIFIGGARSKGQYRSKQLQK